MVMVTGGAFPGEFTPEEDREWVVGGLAEAGSGADQGILHSMFLGLMFTASLRGEAIAAVDDGFGVELSFPWTCLNLCRGPESTCPSFFLAHLLTDSATLWHWSIPDSIRRVDVVCRSRIILALCRWTVMLIEVCSGSCLGRVVSFLWVLGLSAPLQHFMSFISWRRLQRCRAAVPNAPVVSITNGMNWYLAQSRSLYFVLFVSSLCLAVLPGPPASRCGWCVVARGLVTETSMSRCLLSCQL